MKSARTLQWQKHKLSQNSVTSTNSNKIPADILERLIGNSSKTEKAWCIWTESKRIYNRHEELSRSTCERSRKFLLLLGRGGKA